MLIGCWVRVMIVVVVMRKRGKDVINQQARGAEARCGKSGVRRPSSVSGHNGDARTHTGFSPSQSAYSHFVLSADSLTPRQPKDDQLHGDEVQQLKGTRHERSARQGRAVDIKHGSRSTKRSRREEEERRKTCESKKYMIKTEMRSRRRRVT
jgi:hypothetical protein